jgi:dephospho-CoA kinase
MKRRDESVRRPIFVGLTGSVVAGKSVVSKLFEMWGAWRIEADQLARRAVEPGSSTLAEIRQCWGDAILHPDGSLDRDAMRALVFEDEDERLQLETIVHPAIRELRKAARDYAMRAGALIVLEEIPLLFESNLEGDYDVTVVVDACSEVRSERAFVTRGWSTEEFSAIDSSQMPSADKRERADYVIENDGDLDLLERSAQLVWNTVVSSSDYDE